MFVETAASLDHDPKIETFGTSEMKLLKNTVNSRYLEHSGR